MPKGKLILKGIVRLLTPAVIGSGRDVNSDMDLLRDAHGNPYIPATSFVGVLRHMIKLDKSYESKLGEFWGFSGDRAKEQVQSSIIVSDLLAKSNLETGIRDGVKINSKKGIAEEGAKFDYEIIERDSEFELLIEVTLDDEKDDFKKRMLATITHILNQQIVRIGAKTNSGLGKIQLIDYKIYEFDFSKKMDVLRWFKKEFSTPTYFDLRPFNITSRTFNISADFLIKNSLLVRWYNYDPHKPDVEHIKSKGKPVLPGTSIKGAIRARACRIVKTLGKPYEIITELFGNVEEEEVKKGRIIVEESLVEGYSEEVQTRIKIDRFTGGVQEGALLEVSPLFRGKENKLLNIKFSVLNFKDHEAGIMLLILKDLWTGDLPIGGEKAIGRGVLEGRRARVFWDDELIEFDDLSSLNHEDKNKLQNFVSALVNFKDGESQHV